VKYECDKKTQIPSCLSAAALGTTKITQKHAPVINYTVSGKKEATLFSTTTLAFLGRFL